MGGSAEGEGPIWLNHAIWGEREIRVEIVHRLAGRWRRISRHQRQEVAGSAVPQNKLEILQELLRSFGSCLVAYSGGVDSVFLARVAHEVLGDRMLAAIADSPSLPRRELEEALALAKQFSIPVEVVRTNEFDNQSYLANPENRCYFCKHELFTELVPLARARGMAVLAYGENASDIGDHRPGALAASEFDVRSPLKEAGLTKSEIREWSGRMGLPTADKPQMACLSSRIPFGERVTRQKLRMIEQAEDLLRSLGFREYRVRHHELPPVSVATFPANAPRGLPGMMEGRSTTFPRKQTSFDLVPDRFLARLEMGLEEMPRLLQNDLLPRVTTALKEIGYSHVTLDLQGYRRGSTHQDALDQVGAATPAGGNAVQAGNAHAPATLPNLRF